MHVHVSVLVLFRHDVVVIAYHRLTGNLARLYPGFFHILVALVLEALLDRCDQGRYEVVVIILLHTILDDLLANAFQIRTTQQVLDVGDNVLYLSDHLDCNRFEVLVLINLRLVFEWEELKARRVLREQLLQKYDANLLVPVRVAQVVPSLSDNPALFGGEAGWIGLYVIIIIHEPNVVNYGLLILALLFHLVDICELVEALARVLLQRVGLDRLGMVLL